MTCGCWEGGSAAAGLLAHSPPDLSMFAEAPVPMAVVCSRRRQRSTPSTDIFNSTSSSARSHFFVARDGVSVQPDFKNRQQLKFEP